MASMDFHILVYTFIPLFLSIGSEFAGDLDVSKIGLAIPDVKRHKCVQFDEDGVKHLGTKTPYRVVENVDERPPSYEGCTPINIAGVIRHGTRTPGVKDAERMRKTLSKIKGGLFSSDEESDSICQHEKDRILSWKLSLESEDGKTLTREGEEEMLELAQRYQKRFPELLPPTYDNSTFLFKFTRTQRTERSAQYFTLGLFGKKSTEVWFPEALDKDPILRFYKLCDRWKVDVKNNEASKFELQLYKNTPEALAVSSRISKHLKLNYNLTYDEASLMYVTCAFEVAWHKERKSPWCAALTKEDIQVFEYGEELKYYWKDGYGFDVNYRQACVLTRNIFDNFKLPSDKGKKALFYFTHSGTLLKLLSNLGLYKDDFKLTHDLSQQKKRERKWKVSYIDAFGTNLFFVLYNCSDGYRVLTLHQERIVHIRGCPERDLCPLDFLRQALGADDSCKYSDICRIPHNHEYFEL